MIKLMNIEELNKTRERLNLLIEANASYDKILEVSIELDNLIAEYMESGNKNIE